MKKQLLLNLLFLLTMAGIVRAQSLSTICGTVLDMNGNPVANHTVVIMGDSSLNPLNSYYNTQVTNSNGFFCDTVPYQPNTSFAFTVMTMDCQNFWHSVPVNLNNQTGNVTFTICANTNTNTFNAGICGTVTDLSGLPIAGQTVYLVGNTTLNPQNTHSSSVVTDANGNYCDSVYFNTGTHDQFTVYTLDCNSLQVSQTVNMNISSTANLQICRTVQTGCQICGILSTQNNVVSTDSSWVYLIQYDSNTQMLTAVDSTMSYMSSPNSPTFCFYNVVAGNYLVKAAMTPWNPNYANYLPTYHGNSLLWSSAQTVTVCPSVNNADITFIAGSNPGGPGFIGGLVTQGANKTQNTALAGATVILKDNSGNNVAWTLTDANGAYSFSNLAYGTYHIWVDVLNLYGTVKIVTISAGTPSSTGNEIEMNLNPVSVESFNWDSESLTLYPNPASALTTISLSAFQSSEVSIEILSVSGVVLQSEFWTIDSGINTQVLDCSALPSGMYFVKFSDVKGSRTLKLSIAH
jgi:hypothetical protein